MGWRDLLIDGTAISTIAHIVSYDGIDTDGPMRGSNLTYPGIAGDTFVPKVRSAYVFSVPLVLLGTSQADFQDRLDDLRALCDASTGSLALTRRRVTGAGNIAETCTGDCPGGIAPTAVNMNTGRVALDLVNLSGVWT